MEKILNYIGGRWADPEGGEFLDNVNPATGKTYSLVANSGPEDVEKAVEAADGAFPAWSRTPLKERIHKLHAIAQLIKSRARELAAAESTDTGKPVAVASRVDIPRASQNLEYFANAMVQFSSECYAMDGEAINYTLRQPLGAVATISPWNLPLYLLTWKVAPALITGNTVVAKPSEVTPMTAFLFSKLCHQAGLPPGVLNIVHGEGPRLGEALITHPKIRAVSFTGSTASGQSIARLAAPHFKKVGLEMGGKNPGIVFADCDFEKAVKTTVHAAFANQGQICLCTSRLFVERPLYARFKAALLKKVSLLRQGDPLDNNVQQGAVVSRTHCDKILSAIDLARSEGGSVLCGGKKAALEGACARGYFIEPTLIEGLGFECRTNQDEIFGPVATLIPFDREEEVLEWANSTRYGLAASVWTSRISRAHRMARDLHSGLVWINSWMVRDLRIPFGGVKASGMGREGGFDGLRFYTETKNVCLETGS